ncbi:MAG: trigger factor [Calditrichaeota bacterium]|nr:MAG: trigger factor [Calditrichota bacterium]
MGEPLNTKVSEKENWQRTVDVVVTQDELKPEIEKAYKKYQKKVKLDGFRAGKAPIPMIKRMYGPRIEAEVVDEILPKIVTEAWKKENLRIVSLPKVEQLDYQPGGDLKITFTVDVEPEFELKKYENFQLEKQVYQVTDEDIEQALADLQEKNAIWETVEEGIEKDHYAMVDFQELDESGLPVIGHKFENEFIHMKYENGELSEIGRQLLGAKAGEKRVVEIVQQSNEADRQKTQRVKYEVTVKEIKKKILPEIDDEFARDVGEYDNLEELKEALRKRVQESTQHKFDMALEHNLIDEINKNNPFDLPPSMVEQYLDSVIEQLKSAYSNQPVDEQALWEQYRANAIWNIKWRLIRDKLAEMHHIEATEDEIRERVAEVAKSSGQDPDRLWNRVKNDEDRLRKYRHDVLEQKVVKFLLERQKIKEKKVTLKDFKKKKIVEP